jgi:DNA-binding NarL/FixJ family response regulator
VPLVQPNSPLPPLPASPRPVVAGFGRVLILKSDRVYGEILQQVVRQEFSSSAVQLTGCLRDARAFLASSRVDLLLLGADLADGETLELLTPASFREQRFWRVLVVTGRKENGFLAQMRSLPLDGVFDPTGEGLEQFAQALRTLAAGRSCWSQSVLERLRQPEVFAASVGRRMPRYPGKRGQVSAADQMRAVFPRDHIARDRLGALQLNEEHAT